MSSDSNFRKFFIDGGNPGSSLSKIKWTQSFNFIKFYNSVSFWSLKTALVTMSVLKICLMYQKPDNSKVKSSDSMVS